MMRGPRSWSVAVRKPDGDIVASAYPLPWNAAAHPWVRRPFVRGVWVLGEQLAIGMRALRLSAAYSLQEATGASVEATERQLNWTMGIGVVVVAVLFIAGPALAAKLGGHAVGARSSVAQNLLEGGIRLGLFVAYILLISLVPGVKRTYQYHGAEHKTIAAYEAGDPFDPALVDRYSTLHVRCGTNFLFIVLFLTIIVGLGVDAMIHGLTLAITARIVAIPLLAGGGYEVIRAAGHDPNSRALHIVSLPGLALQKITTRPPSHGQIEVAVRAIEAVIAAESAADAAAESR